MKKLIKYLQSFRFSRSPVLISTLLFGAFTAGHVPVLKDYLVLIFVALSCHVFGFAMNDLADYRFDKVNPKHLKRISLVSQGFSRLGYLMVMIFQLPIISLLLYFSYPTGGSLPWLIAAFFFVLVYNLLAKRSGRYILLVHLLFPLSLVILCVGIYALFAPVDEMKPVLYLFLAAVYLNLFLVNSLFGSIMDLKSDLEAGAPSVTGFLGCHLEGNKVIISRKVRYLIIVLYWLSVPLMVFQALLNGVPAIVYPVCLLLFVYGWAHVRAYLKLNDPARLQEFYPGTSTMYLFFANTLAWIIVIPDVWWVMVALALIMPLALRRPDRFGWFTLKSLFIRT